jgi:hypothetical protein
MAAPLNASRKRGVKFVWGKEQEEAFEGLKRAISQPQFWVWQISLRNLFFRLTLVGLLWGRCFPKNMRASDNL